MLEQEVQFAGLERTLREPEKIKKDPVGLFIEECTEMKDLSAIAASAVDFSYLSPEQRAESLWAAFQEIKGIISGRKRKEEKISAADARKLSIGLGILKSLYEDKETREAYFAGSKKYLQEIGAINGDYEKYQALNKQIEVAQDAYDASARQMFAGRSEGNDEIEILMFETNKRQLAANRDNLRDLVSVNPELGALTQYETLKKYSGELRQDNFIWSPSRRESLEEIELAALSGKPVLISGESGTGKTRLVEQAAIILTGLINNETPGKDVRFQDLIAKPKISSDGRTYYEYKEIGEAVTGKTSTLLGKPEHKGRIVADDEFNLLPPAEQTERLARIASWTPGKHIRMPVTNEETIVASDFLYCAMVNLASQRYERKKIPPEVLRKFAKVDLDYPPQSNEDPEIYEMMLAALVDENGRMRAAKSEVAPEYTYKENKKTIERDGQSVKVTVRTRELAKGGGFLWRFANALNELNKSFSHNETVLKAKGEAQYVKDLIIDIGTVLSWLKEYGSLGRAMNLEGFIGEKLKTQFLDRAAYSAEDRKLVKDFLKHFVINTDNNAPKKEDKQFENLTAVDIGLLSPRVKYEKVLAEELEISEGYLLNEEGDRIEYFIKPLDFGGIHYTPDPKADNGHFFRGKDGKIYEFLGVGKDTGEPIITPYKQKIRTPEKPKNQESEVIPEHVAEITEKAQELGMELLEVEGSKEAEKLIIDVTNGTIDIETKAGKKTFVNNWKKECPGIPMPCVPSKNDFWYLTQLKNKKIVRNLTGKEQLSVPHFEDNQFLWVDNWQEENYDSKQADTSHRSKLLQALFNQESTVNISRETIDKALWTGDPANRQPTKQHKKILEQLNVDPTQFELRLIRQDEYARSASAKNWGKKNLWTNFDDYFLGVGGDCIGLRGGYHGSGGSSFVDCLWREDDDYDLAVRLVLSRKG